MRIGDDLDSGYGPTTGVAANHESGFIMEDQFHNREKPPLNTDQNNYSDDDNI